VHCLALFVVLFCGIVSAVCTAAAADQATSTAPENQYTESDRSHWSFRQPVHPKTPSFDDSADRDWIRSPIDALILAKLKENGLRPAPLADRRTLIRRLTFDLTGLPPTPAELEAFLNDRLPLAYERLVDRLLASPHYGQRWGQHWLDVVRYAETEGFEYDRHHAATWRYRDYVIRSFNADKPYNQFVLEQLAGDELAEILSDRDDEQVREMRIAAGFHRLGPVRRNAGNAEVAFSRNEVLTEMTNMIGSAFLGLTVGCARCHDHMFDPIPQKDYYRLQAFLSATHEYEIPSASSKEQAEWKQRVDALEAEIGKIKKTLAGTAGPSRQEIEARLKAAEARRPQPLPTIFSVRNDAQKRAPIHLLIRGNEFKKGKQVGLRALGVLLPDDAPELADDTQRPKTVLARWLTEPAHPLTARVMVNRIWLYHFGQGLVETPNDFGQNGQRPSHPELLDWLAVEFMRPRPPILQSAIRNPHSSGWSIKAMHRLIVNSATYQQSSKVRNPEFTVRRQDNPQSAIRNPQSIDPQNRLLWRFSRRRLEAEEIRDAMLAISGRLNRKAHGPSVFVLVDPELTKLLYKPSQWQVTADRNEHDRRSIYLFAKRNLKLPFMDVFDQPDLQTSCPSRESSTHAPQALELLNGRFSNELATAFTRRMRREAGDDHLRQIQLAYVLTASRVPSPTELRLSLKFLDQQPLREFALAMFNLNAFLYVE